MCTDNSSFWVKDLLRRSDFIDLDGFLKGEESLLEIFTMNIDMTEISSWISFIYRLATIKIFEPCLKID